MIENEAVAALSALSHTQRLRVFRALVVAGPAGLLPSVMAEQMDIARNALSFHLKELANADLVSVEQQGRNLIYRADYPQMNALLAFLTEHCCEGGECEISS
ncbi:MAG: metalloregulator ArsR/SmtB family transcription factor [Dokdonella sp.]